MPDEHIDRGGLGPAGIENVEESFATREDSAVEQQPTPEQEPVIEGGNEGKKYEKLLSQVSSAVPTQNDTEVDLEHLTALEGETEKVEHLTKIAKTKGLPHAVTVAMRLKDYYALDTFHDELIDNLYDELAKEGLITKE